MTVRSETVSNPLPGAQECFMGGGEMGALMRSFDWSSTPLGSVEGWPQSLKTALSILLASGYPMYIAWGPQFIQFYNDAYRPILGSTKHPQALGQGTPECFAEIWDFIGPMFRRAITTGEATTLTDQLLSLDRNGYVEECYFTLSYSAIRDETGSVGGVFVTVIETTERVLSERRVTTLREFATETAGVRTTEQACEVVEKVVGRNPQDLPFALLYLLEEDGKTARLMGLSGLEKGTAASPLTCALEEGAPWPFREVQDTQSSVLRTDIRERFGSLPAGAWPETPPSALVLPITRPGHGPLAGFLVAGISARLALDNAYRGYLDLLAGSVATVLGNARAYETERQRAEALAELDRAKTTFFSNVSHEFRTPLTLVLGQLEEILARPQREGFEEDRAILAVVHRNSLRLLKLVNTLLDFSRIEAGRVQASFEATDLSRYTADLASMFRSAVEKAGMRLLVNCPPLAEPVYVDREMWEKIVLNLVSNAFKFTLEGEIEVAIRERNGVVELTVRDTGTGITQEQLPHIFERFHRIEGTRARVQEGTGIGLALVQELVRIQGGDIHAESIYGEGTCFTVRLPSGTAHVPKEMLRNANPLASSSAETNPYVTEALRWIPQESSSASDLSLLSEEGNTLASEPNSRTITRALSRIVLADDNVDMREYVAELLRPHYEVIEVTNGSAALQAIHEYQPHLVLSDVMMPGLNGFELLQAIRAEESTRALPFILLSARAGEEARVEGLAAGADDYLTKPFSAKELLARVTSHLEMAEVRKAERVRLAQIFLQAPAFIAVLRGPDHVFELANPPYYQLVGHRDLLGKKVLQALPEVEEQGFVALLDEVYRTRNPYVGKYMRVLLQTEADAPLQERFVDFVYQPLVEADGSVSGIFVHGVDLTDRKRVEEALQESERRYRVLADALPQLVWTTRADGFCDYLSRQWVDYTGVPAEEQLGLDWLNVVHPEDQQAIQQHWNEAVIRTGVYDVEYRIRCKDGHYGWFKTRGVPIRDAEGAIVRWFGTCTDIDDIKRFQQTQALFAVMNARLYQDTLALNQQLRRAMTETHHRVKNNLQLISALIDMQRDDARETVPMSEFARLGSNVRALGVIHDILTQEAKTGGEQETLSAKLVLERLLAVLEQTTGGRRLNFILDDARLAGRQATSLALITNELVSNALKHGKGDIDIVFRVQEGVARMEVCDDGPGFPADFDPATAANTGLELIENITHWDLRGTTFYENRATGGARIGISFPISL